MEPENQGVESARQEQLYRVAALGIAARVALAATMNSHHKNGSMKDNNCV